jgi:NDP-sugar pyrophosphorylase family protein
MKVIILAAGLGSRLMPLTKNKPKCLVKVLEKPILGEILDAVASLKNTKYIFVVSRFKDMIDDYLKKNYVINYAFAIQDEPKGAGHAVYCAKDFFSKKDEGMLILCSDAIVKFDIVDLLNNQDKNMIWTNEAADPQNFGNIIIKDGKIISFEHKSKNPKSNLISTGIYFIRSSKEFFKYADKIMSQKRNKNEEYRFEEILTLMINDDIVFEPKTTPLWLDCGMIPNLEKSRSFLSSLNKIAPVRKIN